MWKKLSFLVLSGSCLAASVSAQGVSIYWQDDVCESFELGMGARMKWCVDRVSLSDARELAVWASWTLSGFPGGELEKGSDTDNENMYLVDDLGNRYDHSETRLAAADGGVLSDARPVLSGVFVFPKIAEGAREFTFFDADQVVALREIQLSEKIRSDRIRSANVLGPIRRAREITIVYGWAGPKGSVHEEYRLRRTAGGFAAEGVVNGSAAMLPIWEVPAFDVDGFLAALHQSPIIERAYVPRKTQSDHRPTLQIEMSSAGRTIEFFSESHGIGHAPWRVRVGETTYVVPDDTPARALQMLDRFFARDLPTRAVKLLSPYLGEPRASQIWAKLDDELGTEHAYKIAFRLNELLGRGQDDEVWKALARHLENEKKAADNPEPNG